MIFFCTIMTILKITGTALCVQVHNCTSDVLWAEEDNKTFSVGMVEITGCIAVLILKILAENECFNNMFSKGSGLGVKVLKSGTLLNIIKMYRIVVAAYKPKEARLLYLEINFESSRCIFKRCQHHYNFN